MSSEKSNAAANWADWVFTSGWKGIANQFDEYVDWFSVANEMKSYEENQEKYRYYNVGCFEWNRIVLKDRPPLADFYHANRVHLKRDEQFHVIAAQGPLWNTTEDFWEMIFQEKVSTIVQLCNFTEGPERIRCSEYWPKKKARRFGEFTVSLELEDLIDEEIPDVQLRLFTVLKDGETEALSVHHIFYKKWPDYGVPQTVAPLVAIVRWLEENGGMGKESPILVHCLAGIGRTGTLILTMMGIRSIRDADSREDHGSLLMDLAKELRRHRDGSVQTSQQYIYAHASLLKLMALEGKIAEDQRLKEFRYVNPPIF